uniref:Uncharacterized protein n=1 Tax=Romanomermis culicivorax TaxID=13658 RepID=A0A915IZC0_ROMCU
MGVVPISLRELLKGARGIVGFAVSCDLTAMTNVNIRFTDERKLATPSSESTKRNLEEKMSTKSLKPQPKKPKVTGAALCPIQTKETRAAEEIENFCKCRPKRRISSIQNHRHPIAISRRLTTFDTAS